MIAAALGTTDGDSPVVLGRISGVHGVRGWVKVLSFTRPRENLLGYTPWLVRDKSTWRQCVVLESGRSGGVMTARLDIAATRDEAQPLVGADIAVARRQLPELPAGQYYWFELVGLRVQTLEGRQFGRVTGVLETGANDVLEVEGPQGRILIPYVSGHVVQQVDTGAGVIVVEWNPEYL